jgi:hypothetical protein
VMICATCLREGEDGTLCQTREGVRFRFCVLHPPSVGKTCELCGKTIPFGDESSIHGHTVCYDCSMNPGNGPLWLRKG